jgi:hypothetical protein
LLGELKVQISKSYVYLADLHKLGVKTQFYKEMLHAQEFLLDEMTLERKTGVAIELDMRAVAC